MAMTIVGKILVFINLLFSLVVGYIVIMVHTTSVHWRQGFEVQAKELDVARKSERAYKEQNQELIREKTDLAKRLEGQGVKSTDSYTAALDLLNGQVGSLRADVAARDDRLKKQEVDLTEARTTLAKNTELVKQTEVEVQRRQEDFEKVRKTLFAEQANASKLLQEKNEADQRKAAAEIERNNARERALQLEAENRRLAEDLIRSKTNTTATANASTTTGKNPPTGNVEGHVTVVEGGLVKLDVGSDRGLREGHTLEVFRLSNTPGQSRYLGTLRVMKVTPYDAAAQMMTKPSEPIRVGDEVAPTTRLVR